MILKIFLPEKIKDSQLLSSRIIGFSLQDSSISVAQTYVTRSKSVVENVFVEKLVAQPEETVDQAFIKKLKDISKKLPHYDEIRITIPASLVVIKEVTVPFLDAERIRMVLNYEIEAMLPFPLEQAVIDFIIISQSKEEKKSSVLAVAARIQDLEKTLELYQKADLQPTCIVVDILALYGLYQQIPTYTSIAQSSAIIDIGSRATKIAFLDKGTLRFVRNLNKGSKNIAEKISAQTKNSLEQVETMMTQQGIQKNGSGDYNKIVQEELLSLFNEIQFTLNSFSLRLDGENNAITQLLLIESGIKINNLTTFAHNSLQIECNPFDIGKIVTNKRIKNKALPKMPAWEPALPALGSALLSKSQSEFNLRRKTLTLIPLSLIKKQWITATALIICLLSFIGITGYLQIKTLASTVAQLEKREIEKLKNLFPRDSKALKGPLTLKKIIKDAEVFVNDKQEMWAPFSQQRLRPLEILQELTRLIDKQRFDVSIDELSITTEEGSQRILLSGFFKSKTGFHFQEFGLFQKVFQDSKTLVLAEEMDPTLADDRGVKFTAQFKQKEV
jgi:type IV pilus assembly protein PilM